MNPLEPTMPIAIAVDNVFPFDSSLHSTHPRMRAGADESWQHDLISLSRANCTYLRLSFFRPPDLKHIILPLQVQIASFGVQITT